MGQVLVIDDEKPIRDMVCFALRQANLDCVQAPDTATAYQHITRNRPDIILLDWMLPESSGIDFARMLQSREIYSDIPIIMLTARAEEHDKLKGFSVGCDDYITKPFSTRELIARIKAVLKRGAATPGSEDILRIGKLRLDNAGHRVMFDAEEIHMGPTEYRLLQFLMRRPERAFTRSQLLDFVWGETAYVEERTVDVHIRRLRKALEPYEMSGIIQTVRGAGYRLSSRT